MYNEGMEFSRLENAAIETILSKPVDGMEMARTQFAAASVVERDYTSVGFYTTISVPSSVPLMPNTRELRTELFVGAVACPKSDPEGWIHFMLWTSDGYLACLEGCTVRDSWPDEDDIEDFTPCETRPVDHSRPQLPEDDLIPDCHDRFETWRRNTSGVTLLKSAILGLITLVMLAIIGIILVNFFV
jgi:hypothetical protein